MATVGAPPKSRDRARTASPRVRIPLPRSQDEDGLVVIPNATWKQYKEIQRLVEEARCGRVSLFDGWLQIMTTSRLHEIRKKNLAILVEAYLFQIQIEWIPWGEATMESELKRSGHQPDESYCFHSEKENPDLAIEIAITSGGIDKLGFYRQYEVPEVWFWIEEGLRIFKLGDDGYDEAEKSGWLPDLDVGLLTECVKIKSPRDARKKFMAGQST